MLDEEQAASLGLPKGTMWFDPTDPAQMQMIKDQLEGKPAVAPSAQDVAPKPKAPRKTRLMKEDDMPSLRQTLRVPEECDSEAQVMRYYKRLAPGSHPSVTGDASATQLKSLTESCQACLAEIRSKSSSKVGELDTIGEEEEDGEGSPKKESKAPEGYMLVEDVDPIEFYDEIFFHNQKHAQLKVGDRLCHVDGRAGGLCCSMLQCVVVHCSVSQCIAAWCSVLQYVAVYCSVLQYVAVYCSV